jgi:MFS family permease
MPLGWVTGDAWLIITARSIRSFAQASIVILIGPYLSLLGFGIGRIGLFITIGMAGSAVFTLLVVLFGESIGRRRLMAGFSVLTALTGLALLLTDQYALLALMAFVGAFNVAGGGPAGPVQPLERAAITDTVPPRRRTDLFAVYTATSTWARAFGALAAGSPIVFQRLLDMDEIDSYRVMFAVYTGAALIAGVLYAKVSAAAESGEPPRRFMNPFTLPSRRIIFTISGFGAVDSFATRLVVQTLVALWFKTRFDVDIGEIAIIFFTANVLNALSLWIAAKLANRFGLLNTIVGTHIPAVLAVAALPFMPNAQLAVTLWLVRSFFSQMDGPPKQSYTMAVVNSQERVAVGGISQLSQNTLGALAPTVAALLWSSIWIGAPFVASAIVKTIYLTGFYTSLRNVRPPEEREAAEERKRASEGTP